MNKRRICKSIIVSVLAFSLLIGCSNNGSDYVDHTNHSEPSKNGEVKTMLTEAEYLYERTEMYPGIMVDLLGYVPTEDKLAVLEGAILPFSFNVIDNETGDVVYTGVVQKQADVCNEDTEYGVADFTSLTSEGSYHIEAELIGRSKDFEIKDSLYSDFLKDVFVELESLKKDSTKEEKIPLEQDSSVSIEVSGGWITNDRGERDVVEGCLAAFDLLKAYEYYKKVYSEEDIPGIVKEEAKWLIKMQNQETGGVYSSISRKDDSENFVVVGETTRATAYFSALMAKCSYFYVSLDPDFSKLCLQKAVNAWNCLEANRELVGASQMFRAATELYRATGSKEYLDVLNDYLSVNSNKKYEERIEIDAAMSYMSTSRPVNLTYCTTLMQQFMSQCEKLASDSKEAKFFIASDDYDEMKILWNIAILVEADYILTSREYGDIELNYFHYLYGRNPDSTICTGFKNNPDAYAELVLLMGRLLTDNTIK